MTRAKTVFNIKFDVQAAEQLADRFAKLTGEQIERVTVPVLNKVTERTYDLATKRITQNVNLTEGYLRPHIKLEPATPGRPVASITATGDRDRLTPLSRYGAQPVLVARKSKKARGRGPGGLAINNDQTQRGVKVAVKTGTEKTISYAFFLPLRRGTVPGGNGFGVFTRPKGGGKYRHRYGPQVYELFETQAVDIQDETLDDMEASLSQAALDLIDDTLI